MPMPNRNNINNNYRYAYQGQEKDPETGKEAFELRLWDARIGRWLTTDPAGQYSSPYLGMGNNPIRKIDPDGGTADDHIFLDSDNNEVGRVAWDGADRYFKETYEGGIQDGLNVGSFNEISFEDSIIYFNINRDFQTDQSTTGSFAFGNVSGYTLERPGPDTVTPNLRLRIPEGEYNVSLHNGNKYKNVLKLHNENVSIDRAILIHNGNYPKNTDGCILVGCSRGKNAVWDSKTKLNEIRNVFHNNDIKRIRVRIHNSFIKPIKL